MDFISRIIGMFNSHTQDEPHSKQLVDYDVYTKRMSIAFNAAKKHGVSSDDFKIEKACDAISTGIGKFGTIDNPIPVNGTVGEFAYLNRLRTSKGVAFLYHRIGSYESKATRHPVDMYYLASEDATEYYSVCLCPYFPRRSILAPFGLKLVSWNKMEDLFKQIFKYPINGTNFTVDNFPFNLPEALEQDKRLLSIGLADANALRIRRIIENSKHWKKL